MSNYTKTTDFEAKDSLPTGDAEKIIRGADFETEFDNIATAIATKADTAGPTFTGIVTIPTAAVTTLSLDGTTVTSTAAEINLLDGVTATTAELNLLDGVTATTAELNILDGVTATAAELNTLDGITSTTAELNTLDGFTGTYEDLNFAQTLRASGVTGDEFDILDGLTATAAELNILDGATVTTAELNLLDGVTATTAELNILDGVTSTAAELNILDGVTSTAAELNLVDGSTAGTVVNSKAVVYGAAGEVNATTLQVGGVAITSTPAELNLLDGATVTTAEINILDGVTATTAELNLLDGVTATTAELNILDGVTATAAELNTLDGITSTTAELNILDGVTATAAELNTMDGITATTAELNILDGVTADATELNKLDGVTATTSELNYVDVTTLGVVEASKAVTADANADVLFGDNDKLKFGAGSDLQIYHDGSNSYIDDAGTGALQIRSNGLYLQKYTNENMVRALADGAVSLYYDNAIKLETTSTGIDVTGTVSADGAEIDVTRSDTAGSGFLTLDLVGTGGDFAHRVDTSNAYYLDYYTGSAWRPTIKIEGQTGDISFYEDTGTTAKLFWDASAESLGLGTDSPSARLHLKNSTGAAATLLRLETGWNNPSGNKSIEWTDSTNTLGRISVDYTAPKAKMRFGSLYNSGYQTSDIMTLTADGNVGIGTDSPADTLSVVNLGSSGTGVQISSGTAIGDLRFKARTESYNGILSVYDSGGNEDVKISAHSGVDTYFNSGSNVGIGTSSPSSFNQVGADTLVVGSGSGEQGITIYSGTANNGVLAFADGTTTTQQYQGYIGYNHSSNFMRFFTGAEEAMRIDSSGNLLVGTTSIAIGQGTATGVSVRGPIGRIEASADGTTSGIFNRTTSDGGIVNFSKNGSTVGSIGTAGSRVYISGPSSSLHSGLIFTDNGSEGIIAPSTNAGAIANGTTDLGYSGGRFKDGHFSGNINANTFTAIDGLYIGGVGFANKLDDYEEGTWTPTLYAATTGTNRATSIVSATYTKIGRLVRCKAYLSVVDGTALNGDSGAIQLGGLPFTASAYGHLRTLYSNLSSSSITGIVTGTAVGLRVGDSQTALQPSDINTGSNNIMIDVTFEV